MDTQPPGNEQEAATITASARCEFIRGMGPAKRPQIVYFLRVVNLSEGCICCLWGVGGCLQYGVCGGQSCR
jgi:hypothetical protein